MSRLAEQMLEALGRWKSNPTLRNHDELVHLMVEVSETTASCGEETVFFCGVWVSPTLLNLVLDSELLGSDLVAA